MIGVRGEWRAFRWWWSAECGLRATTLYAAVRDGWSLGSGAAGNGAAAGGRGSAEQGLEQRPYTRLCGTAGPGDRGPRGRRGCRCRGVRRTRALSNDPIRGCAGRLGLGIGGRGDGAAGGGGGARNTGRRNDPIRGCAGWPGLGTGGRGNGVAAGGRGVRNTGPRNDTIRGCAGWPGLGTGGRGERRGCRWWRSAERGPRATTLYAAVRDGRAWGPGAAGNGAAAGGGGMRGTSNDPIRGCAGWPGLGTGSRGERCGCRWWRNAGHEQRPYTRLFGTVGPGVSGSAGNRMAVGGGGVRHANLTQGPRTT